MNSALRARLNQATKTKKGNKSRIVRKLRKYTRLLGKRRAS